ncbi:unnamed protein product, partial [Oppiella nova]
MHIISISSISEVQMDFTCDFYFRQGWRDTRLSFEKRPGIDALYVGAEVSDRIWVPDTFFANEKSAQFHSATTPNTFIRITSKDGYSMADIMYKWGIDGKGSVGMSDQVELPQFKVKGLKQLQKIEYLST